jgi:hypothetical protein
MNLTVFVLAALLAGMGTLNLHPNDVSGGGPVGAPQPTSVVVGGAHANVAGGGPSGRIHLNDVLGGGPVGAPHPTSVADRGPSRGVHVNDVLGGGPSGAPKP